MTNFLKKIRTWALIKLAAGRPVVLNLKLNKGLYLHSSTNNALFVNVHVVGDSGPAFILGQDRK